MAKNAVPLSMLDNGGLDTYPMSVFSQRLSPKEQSEFLIRWDEYMRKIGIVPVYPVQDGLMGKNPKILSYGKYNKYDALAPEFRTFDTIQKLALKHTNPLYNYMC